VRDGLEKTGQGESEDDSTSEIPVVRAVATRTFDRWVVRVVDGQPLTVRVDSLDDVNEAVNALRRRRSPRSGPVRVVITSYGVAEPVNAPT